MVLFPPKITGHLDYLTQGLGDNRTKWSWVLSGQFGPRVLSPMQASCPGWRTTPPLWPHTAPGPFAPLVLFLGRLGPKCSPYFTFRLRCPPSISLSGSCPPPAAWLHPPPNLHAASSAWQKPLGFTCSSSSTSTGSLSWPSPPRVQEAPLTSVCLPLLSEQLAVATTWRLLMCPTLSYCFSGVILLLCKLYEMKLLVKGHTTSKWQRPD